MISKTQLEMYPITNSVFQLINESYILFSKTFKFIMGSFDEEYLSFSEDLLSILKRKCDTETDFVNSIKAFIKYSHEYLLLQIKLNKEGKYLYSRFDEINRQLYQNEKIMNVFYLDGLLLSQVLWPNHYRMGKYFINHRNLTTPSSLVLDVGSGNGIYSYYIAKYFKYKEVHSIDISPHSQIYTEGLLKHTLLDTSRIFVEVKDIFSLEGKSRFDLIVCGELIEHVESPDELLDRLLVLLKDDGTLFLTTAIYAAAIDHIYLFNNVNEVRELLEKHFQINSELILPTSLEDYRADMNKVPINYACTLTKKHETTR